MAISPFLSCRSEFGGSEERSCCRQIYIDVLIGKYALEFHISTINHDIEKCEKLIWHSSSRWSDVHCKVSLRITMLDKQPGGQSWYTNCSLLPNSIHNQTGPYLHQHSSYYHYKGTNHETAPLQIFNWRATNHQEENWYHAWKGITRPSTSYWPSKVELVFKEGGSTRLCVYFCKLNFKAYLEGVVTTLFEVSKWILLIKIGSIQKLLYLLWSGWTYNLYFLDDKMLLLQYVPEFYGTRLGKTKRQMVFPLHWWKVHTPSP